MLGIGFGLMLTHFCDRVFRALAVEGRFCALGLVLVGVLARVVKGLGHGPREMAEVRADGVAEHVDRKVVGEDGGLDLGERLERSGNDDGIVEGGSMAIVPMAVHGVIEAGQSREMMSMAETVGQVKVAEGVIKRKKRRKNAIDDLFSGIT